MLGSPLSCLSLGKPIDLFIGPEPQEATASRGEGPGSVAESAIDTAGEIHSRCVE